MSDLQTRLAKIAQWIQQEDDPILYTPLGVDGEPLGPEGSYPEMTEEEIRVQIQCLESYVPPNAEALSVIIPENFALTEDATPLQEDQASPAAWVQEAQASPAAWVIMRDCDLNAEPGGLPDFDLPEIAPNLEFSEEIAMIRPAPDAPFPHVIARARQEMHESISPAQQLQIPTTTPLRHSEPGQQTMRTSEGLGDQVVQASRDSSANAFAASFDVWALHNAHLRRMPEMHDFARKRALTQLHFYTHYAYLVRDRHQADMLNVRYMVAGMLLHERRAYAVTGPRSITDFLVISTLEDLERVPYTGIHIVLLCQNGVDAWGQLALRLLARGFRDVINLT